MKAFLVTRVMTVTITPYPIHEEDISPESGPEHVSTASLSLALQSPREDALLI